MKVSTLDVRFQQRICRRCLISEAVMLNPPGVSRQMLNRTFSPVFGRPDMA